MSTTKKASKPYKITVTPKALPGDLVMVKNYRKKNYDVEPGEVTATRVSLGLTGGRTRNSYEVLLDRKIPRPGPWPDRVITLTVWDELIVSVTRSDKTDICHKKPSKRVGIYLQKIK